MPALQGNDCAAVRENFGGVQQLVTVAQAEAYATEGGSKEPARRPSCLRVNRRYGSAAAAVIFRGSGAIVAGGVSGHGMPCPY